MPLVWDPPPLDKQIIDIVDRALTFDVVTALAPRRPLIEAMPTFPMRLLYACPEVLPFDRLQERSARMSFGNFMKITAPLRTALRRADDPMQPLLGVAAHRRIGSESSVKATRANLLLGAWVDDCAATVALKLATFAQLMDHNGWLSASNSRIYEFRDGLGMIGVEPGLLHTGSASIRCPDLTEDWIHEQLIRRHSTPYRVSTNKYPRYAAAATLIKDPRIPVEFKDAVLFVGNSFPHHPPVLRSHMLRVGEARTSGYKRALWRNEPDEAIERISNAITLLESNTALWSVPSLHSMLVPLVLSPTRFEVLTGTTKGVQMFSLNHQKRVKLLDHLCELKETILKETWLGGLAEAGPEGGAEEAIQSVLRYCEGLGLGVERDAYNNKNNEAHDGKDDHWDQWEGGEREGHDSSLDDASSLIEKLRNRLVRGADQTSA